MSTTHSAGRALTAAALGALVALLALAPGALARQPRRTIRGAHPSFARKSQSLGDATSRVTARVYLQPRGGFDGLKQDVVAASTRGSSAYHRFLTPGQYRARYEPDASAVSSVTAWLASAGMKISRVERSRRWVEATGSTSAAEKAFGTSLERFRHRRQLVRAPADSVTAPANVASKVLTVTGLDTTQYRVRPKAKQPPAFVNARPCSTYYGQIEARFKADFRSPLPPFMGSYRPYAPCGYTPSQLRSAYEGGSALNGRGVTVGIVDAYASPSIVKDANQYATSHGDAGFAPGQYQETTARSFTHKKTCDFTGWYGEETLDVEAVHAMAPGAGVHYYGGASCFDDDLDAILARLVDDNRVDMVSNSYGDLGEGVPADEVVAFESIVLQGERQGISFMFSSGDSGDEVANTGTKQPDFSASDPYVTAVGGTSTAINAAGKIGFQTGWGTEKYTLSADSRSWQPAGFLYGAGGGFSQLFNRPAYQNGVVPGNFPAGRAVPDVAMDADPTTGMLIGETQEFPDGNRYGEYRIGGTSLASPLFTGMQALAQQSAGSRQGFLNPVIYGQARSGAATFADVRPVHTGDGNVRPDYVNGLDPSGGIAYSVRTFNQDSSLKTRNGWDEVTGVGVPTPAYLTSLGR